MDIIVGIIIVFNITKSILEIIKLLKEIID